MDFEGIKFKLNKMLPKHRILHSEGVADCAVKLSEIYGYDKDKAYLAGMLHDCAKYLSHNEVDYYVKKYEIYLDEYGLSCIIDLTNEKIKEKVETISKSLENILENKAIDLSKLDSSDDTQKEAIETINNSLNNISSIIKDPGKELTSDDTDKLIEAISSLSSENQKALASEFENSFTEKDKQTLEELYNDLFK